MRILDKNLKTPETEQRLNHYGDKNKEDQLSED